MATVVANPKVRIPVTYEANERNLARERTLDELLCEVSREQDSAKFAQLFDQILARLAEREAPLYRL